MVNLIAAGSSSPTLALAGAPLAPLALPELLDPPDKTHNSLFQISAGSMSVRPARRFAGICI